MTSDLLPGTLAPAGLAGELVQRHLRIRTELTKLGASCLVAIRDETVTYLTGYTTMTWKMHSRPVCAVLAADGRLSVVAAETEVDSATLRIPHADVRSYVALEPPPADSHLPDGRIQFAPAAARALAEVIEEAGPGKVAVDGLGAPWPPIGQLTSLIGSLRGRTVDASALVWGLRCRKSEWELHRMRLAAQVLASAYETVRRKLSPGMTEREIAREFTIAQWEAGAHEVGPLGVVAGPTRGLFGFPTDKPWQRDELLYLDGAAIIDGYWSDFCRTFAARPVSAVEAEGYARTRRGLEAALTIGKEGVTAGEIGRAMGAAMDVEPHAVGFSRFGHGIGLLVPEPPSLHEHDDTVLESGFTICVEPTVCHAGVNYVAEEEHLLTPNGFEPLSARAPDHILRL